MTTNKLLHILLFLCAFPIAICAQESVSLTGSVTDKATGKPLPDVIVSLRKDGKTILFTRTSDDGSFKLKANAMPVHAVLHFSLLNYAPVDVAVSDKRRRYNVQLEERETKLKEVVVKAPDIRQRGDTILYNVASYTNIGDKTLADVLKKMPGMSVSESGEIKYNGVSINKFYIEGHDMLGGKYGMATNNIHPGDVGTVEVMENHQPLRALEDISFSTQPAINIRLKESAKKRLVGTLKAGGGVDPGLWKGELSLMRFAKKMQTLNVLKTNNTGDNILKESSMLFDESAGDLFRKSYEIDDIIDIAPGRLTDLDEQRVLRNQSHSVSLNNLWALGKNTDLSAVVDYGHDRLLSDFQSSTSYMLPDSTIVISEDESAKTHHHNLAAEVSFMTNAKSYYISNKLLTNLDWDDTRTSVLGTLPNEQQASTPHYKIQDNLELLKRSGKRAFTLSSYNTYEWAPQSLDVSRDGMTYRQDMRSSAFHTHTSTSFGYTFRPLTLWIKAGLIAMHRTMRSQAEGIPDSLGSSANKVSVSYLNLYASPELELKADGFNAELKLPVSVAPYSYKNKLSDEEQSKTKCFLSPSLYLRYFLTSSFSLSLSGNISHTAVDEQNFYDALIMGDYRHLYRGLVDFGTNTRKSATLSWTWKKPLQAFFANMSATRMYADYASMSSRLFTGDFMILSRLPLKHSGRSWLIQGNASKGLDFIKGLITASASYIYMDGQMSQNQLLMPFASRTWLVTGKINSKPSAYVNLSYDITFTTDKMRSKSTGISSSTSSLTHRLTANISFSERLYATLRGEYYDNKIADNTRKHLFLGDLSLTYSTKGGWEFSIEARNLFNQRSYAYKSTSELTVFQKQYTIRPRNILATVFLHF